MSSRRRIIEEVRQSNALNIIFKLEPSEMGTAPLGSSSQRCMLNLEKKILSERKLRDSKIYLTEFNSSIKTLSTALPGPDITKTTLLHLTVAENFPSPEPKLRGDEGPEPIFRGDEG